jgi:hypothetical protein
MTAENIDRYQVQSRMFLDGAWKPWTSPHMGIGYPTIEQAREYVALLNDGRKALSGFVQQYATEYRIRHIVGTAEIVE